MYAVKYLCGDIPMPEDLTVKKEKPVGDQGHKYETLVEQKGEHRITLCIQRCIICGCVRRQVSKGPGVLFWSLDFFYPGCRESSILEYPCWEVVASNHTLAVDHDVAQKLRALLDF